MSFADFLLSFRTDRSVASIARTPENNIKVLDISGARITLSSPQIKNELIGSQVTDNWHCWCFGEIFGYRQFGSAQVNLEQIAIDLENNTFQPVDLNGHFVVLANHYPDRTWHIWTNRLGTMHVYYASDGKRAALGTFCPAVANAASRRQLDWLGLSGFFAFGFFPQDRTYFDDVHILRPASHYVFNEDGQLTHNQRYWDWWYYPDDRRTYTDTVAEFGGTLEAILTDQTRSGRIAVPISSGLDSRTVAAIIANNGSKLSGNASRPRHDWSTVQPRLWAYSYGYTSYSPETSIGARIAAARDVPFQRFTIPEYLFDRLDLILASVEGFQGVASTRQAAIVEEVASHADYLIAAHWGDVWMDDMGLLERDKLGDADILAHALDKIENKGRGWLLEHLCRQRLGKEEPENVLRDLVAEELKRVAQIEEADFRVKAFKTEQWSFRWTVASLRMFQPGAFPRLPFYDNRMVDFCCTVPSKFVSQRRLQIDYLKRFHADVARIPWDVTGNSLFYDTKSKSWELSKRAWRKMCRIVTNRPHVGRNWEVQFLNEKGKAGLHEWLLHPGLKIHEFVSIEAIKNLLDELFITPNAGNGYTVSSLLTFSAWLERYG